MDKDLFLKLNSMLDQNERKYLKSETFKWLSNEEMENLIGNGDKNVVLAKLESIYSLESGDLKEESKAELKNGILVASGVAQITSCMKIVEDYDGGTFTDKLYYVVDFALRTLRADEDYQAECLARILCNTKLGQTAFAVPFADKAINAVSREEAEKLFESIKAIENNHTADSIQGEYLNLLASFGEIFEEQVPFYAYYEENPKSALKLLDEQYGNIDLTPETRVRVKRRKPKSQKIES